MHAVGDVRPVEPCWRCERQFVDHMSRRPCCNWVVRGQMRLCGACRANQGWLRRLVEVGTQDVEICVTNKEVRDFGRVISVASAGEQKRGVARTHAAHANNLLYPTGSLDHVASWSLAGWALSQYFGGSVYSTWSSMPRLRVMAVLTAAGAAIDCIRHTVLALPHLWVASDYARWQATVGPSRGVPGGFIEKCWEHWRLKWHENVTLPCLVWIEQRIDRYGDKVAHTIWDCERRFIGRFAESSWWRWMRLSTEWTGLQARRRLCQPWTAGGHFVRALVGHPEFDAVRWHLLRAAGAAGVCLVALMAARCAGRSVRRWQLEHRNWTKAPVGTPHTCGSDQSAPSRGRADAADADGSAGRDPSGPASGDAGLLVRGGCEGPGAHHGPDDGGRSGLLRPYGEDVPDRGHGPRSEDGDGHLGVHADGTLGGEVAYGATLPDGVDIPRPPGLVPPLRTPGGGGADPGCDQGAFLTERADAPGFRGVVGSVDCVGTPLRAAGARDVAAVVDDDGVLRTIEPMLRGVVAAPCTKAINIPANDIRNVRDAIEHRIDAPRRPVALTQSERNRIGRMVSTSLSNHARYGIWSEKAINDWALDKLDWEELKSGKWSTERMETSLNKLLGEWRPVLRPTAQIKPEHTKHGKAPRLLIADGDDGQLMALVIIKCFEDLLFKHLVGKSIKHKAKRDAMKKFSENMRRQCRGGGLTCVEGDGSHWDGSEGLEIRDIIENPVLAHIASVLAGTYLCPEAWVDEHARLNTAAKTRLFFKNKMRDFCVTIRAIRRSGHRGTSCLNYWNNYVLWHCCLFAKPEVFLDPLRRVAMDVWGEKSRWAYFCFEGDDSAGTTTPSLDAHTKDIESFWQRAGFHMKLSYPKERLSFAGWWFGVDDNGLNDARSPDLPRALATLGLSVSPTAVSAFRAGDVPKLRRVFASKFASRALEFSGLLPTVSRMFWSLHEHFAEPGQELLDDDRMRLGKDEVIGSISDVELRVGSANAETDVVGELGRLFLLGWEVDDEASLLPLISMDGAQIAAMSSADFRTLLPPSWR